VERPSKEHIVREIRRLTEEADGTPIGQDKFEAVTGIATTVWRGRYWARWTDAVREAGFEPNAFGAKKHDDTELVHILAKLTRELGAFPTSADLRLRRHVGGDIPSHNVFERLGTQPQRIAKVLAFADADPDFADVAAICAPLVARKPRPPRRPVVDEPALPVTGVVYLTRMGEFYKVGRTNDIDRRTRELRTQLPVKEELLHVIETDDPSGIEAYWHRRFASRRANGEWFTLDENDVAAFKRRTYM
jgi:hypothetical protein